MVVTIAWTLSMVIASYVIGFADGHAIRWLCALVLLVGVTRVGLLARQRLRLTERLRQELKVSNARLSVALRAAQMGTWTWDPKSDLLDLDAFERELFGLSERNYVASELVMHAHPDDVGAVKGAVGKALRDGTPVDYEFRYRDGEGGWRWVEGSAMRHIQSGSPPLLVGVNRDISQRKQQELELSLAKQRAEFALVELEQSRVDLDLALRSGRFGVWRTTRAADAEEGGLDEPIDWDAGVRRIFGRSDDERVTRRSYFDAIHPEDRNRVLAGLSVLRDGGQEYADQYRIVRPDGTERTIAVAAVTGLHSNPRTGKDEKVTTGIVRDVTDEENLKADLRQRVREAQLTSHALEQARTNLELALRSGQLGAWSSEFRDVDEADDLDAPSLDDPITWDINVRRIYGYGAEEPITRRHFFEALHPEDREEVLAHLAEVAERGEDYAHQYRIVRPDGEIRWVAVQATFVWRSGPDGRRTKWMIGIAKDVTQEENLKADLRQKALEAQRATEAKARFLAMMSHEIRTPMNGVVGMIELLLETPLSSEQQLMLRSCKDSAFALLTVINDVLDYSKVEAGKLELDYTAVSLRRLSESVGEALGIHATQRGIDLDIDVSPDVPRRVLGDRVRLRQILTNLVGNAIKFTERGGVVLAVSLDRCEPTDSPVHVRFDVIDSGIGMDEETLQGLFQPFQQADAATTRRFGGTGLGLSIVKHLTELMGGRVECESQPSRGSRFSVVIPFEVASAEGTDKENPIAGVKVLAVAANETRRRILADFLSRFDAGIEFCDSADVLLARAGESSRHGRIDLILLDKGWASSECADLRRRFDEHPGLSDLPFVIVRTLEPTQAASIPNATLVSGNPLTRDGLVRAIAVALGRASAPTPAIAEEYASEELDPSFREQQEEAGRLILLAEDHPTNREVISRQLKRLGYACDVAESGASAWAKLQSGKRYALLLTDCHMPDMDGYELTRLIRNKERSGGGPELPIVAVTASVLQGEGERCRALGMNGYLGKPLQMRELKRVLAEFLPRDARQEPQEPVVDVMTEDQSPVRYRELAEILGHNRKRLVQVLGIFEESTRGDCESLDAAYGSGDWKGVRDLAHKLKSGCRQLGEGRAASALEAVENKAGQGFDFADDFASARDELRRVLGRVSDYLAAP
nr:PAS domain-containing protein [Pseudoxanthomonas helianthi]